MTKNELKNKYYITKVSSHSKGAAGGKKVKIRIVFNESLTRRDYLHELEAIDRKNCGLFLCHVEFNDMSEDRWWDVPQYRDEFVKGYRERIKQIRINYGLSKSDVAEFMRVA